MFLMAIEEQFGMVVEDDEVDAPVFETMDGLISLVVEISVTFLEAGTGNILIVVMTARSFAQQRTRRLPFSNKVCRPERQPCQSVIL